MSCSEADADVEASKFYFEFSVSAYLYIANVVYVILNFVLCDPPSKSLPMPMLMKLLYVSCQVAQAF